MDLIHFLLNLITGSEGITSTQRLAFLIAIVSIGSIYIIFLKFDRSSIMGNSLFILLIVVFAFSIAYTFAGKDYFDYKKSIERDKSWTEYLMSQDPKYNVTSRHMEFVGKESAYRHVLEEIEVLPATPETITLNDKVEGALKAVRAITRSD